jgi:hypothetical protein
MRNRAISTDRNRKQCLQETWLEQTKTVRSLITSSILVRREGSRGSNSSAVTVRISGSLSKMIHQIAIEETIINTKPSRLMARRKAINNNLQRPVIISFQKKGTNKNSIRKAKIHPAKNTLRNSTLNQPESKVNLTTGAISGAQKTIKTRTEIVMYLIVMKYLFSAISRSTIRTRTITSRNSRDP